MGLKDLSRKELKKVQEMLKFFDIFGISEEDLRLIPQIKVLLENKKEADKPISPSPKESKAIEEAAVLHGKPEDVIKLFTGETKEFYPDGRKPNRK